MMSASVALRRSHVRVRLPVIALLAALVSAGAPLRAQHEGHGATTRRGRRAATIGTVTFPNSGNAAAQAPFLRGIALLHNFEYEDAADAFRRAQRADAAFALPYWAEALTYTHIMWGEENLAAARAVLHRLAATPAERLAKARTSRERLFGAAVEAAYADVDGSARVRG